MLQVLKSFLKVRILFCFYLIISRPRPRRPCCQLSILISYFSLQQMEVCPLYFLCISPSEWRLNPREADRLVRSARGELGLLRLHKVLGVSVLTAGEAMRLMCFFCFFFLLVAPRTVALMDEGLVKSFAFQNWWSSTRQIQVTFLLAM